LVTFVRALIGAQAKPAIEAVLRIRAAALRDQTRGEEVAAVDDAHEVDADDPPPVVERRLPDRAGGGDAGVVHDQIDRPRR
jgi:hypothetical protein